MKREERYGLALRLTGLVLVVMVLPFVRGWVQMVRAALDADRAANRVPMIAFIAGSFLALACGVAVLVQQVSAYQPPPMRINTVILPTASSAIVRSAAGLALVFGARPIARWLSFGRIFGRSRPLLADEAGGQ